MVGNDNSEMISLKLYVEVEPKTKIDKLFTKESVKKIDESINVELLSKKDSLAFNGNLELEYLIAFGIGVASGVVGNCIYNAICSVVKKLEINGRRTKLTEEGISQAIETVKLMLAESETTNNTKNDEK